MAVWNERSDRRVVCEVGPRLAYRLPGERPLNNVIISISPDQQQQVVEII